MFEIRKLNKDEHDFLKEMLYESIFIDESKKPPLKQLLDTKDMLKYHINWGRPGDQAFIALNSEDKPVGAVWFRLLQGMEKGYGYVDDHTPELGIAVSKEGRGQGLGRKLMLAVLEQAKIDGFLKLSLSVDPDNISAVKLYQSLGFVEVGMEGTSITMVANLDESSFMNMIRELEESHLHPDIRKSSEKLGHILADNFVEIGSSGRMFGKEECLADGVSPDEMTIHDFAMRRLSEGIVLTTYQIMNKINNRRTLRSSIWKQIDGRWQLYFHQGTIKSSETEYL